MKKEVIIKNLIRIIILILIIWGVITISKLIVGENNEQFQNKTNTKTTYYKISIDLLDSETLQPITESNLELKDQDNKVVDTWTTDGNTHSIYKLTPGNYTLTQITTPDNYELNQDSITITITNKDEKYTMYNQSITITEEQVEVESTLSLKNIKVTLLGIISTLLGLIIISRKTKPSLLSSKN